MGYVSLKGRDASLHDELRRAEKFEFAIALLERHVVAMPRESEDGRASKRRRDGSNRTMEIRYDID